MIASSFSRPQATLLPDDPSVDRLDDATRRAIAGHWQHRATAERTVAIGFEQLLPRLRDVGAEDVVLALAAKAIDDERRHGDLCARLAARYLDSAIDPPAPEGVALPDFGTGDEPIEVSLLVLGTCCINESIASEWIRSCWAIASAPTALAANRAHLRDEIDHARLGWAYVASPKLTAAHKRVLRGWIPRLMRVNVAEWRKPDAHLPEDGVRAHGHLSRVENELVIDSAVRDVVLPGLAHVGLA